MAAGGSDPKAEAACQSYLDGAQGSGTQTLNRAYTSSLRDLDRWRVAALTGPGGPQLALGDWDAVRGIPGETEVSTCFVDGPVAKAPPGGDPFDRSLFMVLDDGRVIGIAAGYTRTLVVERPVAD